MMKPLGSPRARWTTTTQTTDRVDHTDSDISQRSRGPLRFWPRHAKRNGAQAQSLAVFGTVVSFLLAVVSPANAESSLHQITTGPGEPAVAVGSTTPLSTPPTWRAIDRSAEDQTRIRFTLRPEADRQPLPSAGFQQSAFAGRSRTPRSNEHRVRAAVAGALIGLITGALIGSALDRNCACDDPGLRGSMLGAPIGMAGGAALGFVLSSR